MKKPATERRRKWREGGKHVRTAHMLPNLFTSGNVSCGIASILMSCDGRFEAAGWLILAGLFFDALDGHVARLLRASSAFGVQLDSLADVITFGVAPALLFRSMLYPQGSRLGFSLAILYGLCTTLRLARYNVSALKSTDKVRTLFVGLPCPSAAGLLAALAIVFHEYAVFPMHEMLQTGSHLLIVALSVLMVSRVSYPDLVALHVERRSIFNYMVVAVVILSLIVIDPPMVLLALAVCFVFGGPFVAMWARRRSHRIEEGKAADEATPDTLETAEERPVTEDTLPL